MIRASKFIIARGGFNTLSESLVLKIPGLLVEEKIILKLDVILII